MAEDNPTFVVGDSRVSLSDLMKVATIGVGSFARVFLCRLRDDASSAAFALKRLKKSHVLRLKQVEHVKNEKRVLQILRSPFSPRLCVIDRYACFQDRRCLYFLSEFVIGGELFKRMRASGSFPNDVALFYASEVVCFFSYLHSQSIVYRDLKPENILLDQDGHIKLVDFGFSKVVTDKTYTLCGTPEYLSPEAIEHKGHNRCVDWWAFGVLVYEMLCGVPPFYDDNPYHLYEKIIQCRFEIPQRVGHHAADLIRRLLDPDQEQRLGVRVSNRQGGVAGVKAHQWFAEVDFARAERRELPAPWMPNISRADDFSCFDEYPDSSDPEVPAFPQGVDPFQAF